MSFLSFAFVEFESTEDAKDALENLNNSDIEGRTIRLEYSQNSGRGEGGRGNSGRISLAQCESEQWCVFKYWFKDTRLRGPDVMKD